MIFFVFLKTVLNNNFQKQIPNMSLHFLVKCIIRNSKKPHKNLIRFILYSDSELTIPDYKIIDKLTMQIYVTISFDFALRRISFGVINNKNSFLSPEG